MVPAQKLALDVTSDQSVAEAVAAAGRIDVLINNAGIGLWGPIEATPLAQAQSVFETNVWGPIRMMLAVAPQMRTRQSGRIIQISSAAGRIAGPLVGHYAASKHALEAHSEALRIELGIFGISVVIVELGAVESDFPKNRVMTSSPDYEKLVTNYSKHLLSARQEPKSSEYVAAALADIVAEPTPKLMYESTPDVTRLVGQRRQQNDAEWEAGVRAILGL